ncbi:response regulator transcription factor [Paenactinomyces guangxiensis]|uniref:Response regulator transcription factor n=1 Tax=Paenactinomyces guangxiensis TaxID=1490290 RepID=A0A7W2A866_9BACL|nr:response regulator transcription factor [Paenactinomyces guangxiensis]MBA4493849.1 response regulator transcription factor [Paenactinomyces guangxiensis]MBH8591315.1 response regulator transcription factor [Paenactinomyces guangxiensis]
MREIRILLVDDETEILNLIRIVLKKEGFTQIFTAMSAAEAIHQCRQHQPHLIVLDVMLPDGEGFDVCREMRQMTNAPILFLTARTTDLDKLTGFSMGGDDYITKPFNPLELAARIKAQLRRLQLVQASSQARPKIHDFGRFCIHEESGQLFVEGKEVSCPAMEFKLLLFLCSHPNRIFSKKQLYEQVWGEESLGDENTVMVHMRRLREKIERDPSHPEWLVTVRGLGYKLVVPQRGLVR